MALLAPAHLAAHCDAGRRYGCLGGQGQPRPDRTDIVELVCGGLTRRHHQSHPLSTNQIHGTTAKYATIPVPSMYEIFRSQVTVRDRMLM